MLCFSTLVISILVVSSYGKEEPEKKSEDRMAPFEFDPFPYTQWKFDSFPVANLAAWDSPSAVDSPMNKRWASQIRFGKRSSWASKVRFG